MPTVYFTNCSGVIKTAMVLPQGLVTVKKIKSSERYWEEYRNKKICTNHPNCIFNLERTQMTGQKTA